VSFWEVWAGFGIDSSGSIGAVLDEDADEEANVSMARKMYWYVVRVSPGSKEDVAG
jgi:hypothetical protein